MRLAVCGWQGKGRALRSPDDRAWWASKTALPFWPALATYADTVASNAGETSWVLDPKLFAGDSIAISDELVFVAGDLAAMEAEHAADCVPYFMPKRASTQPLPNLPCLAKIKGKQNPGEVEKILPRPLFPRGHIPPWAFWLAIAYLVTKIPE